MKVSLVAAGYLAAFLAASAALALRIASTAGPDRQAYSGMYAFGDLSFFVAVFGLVSLVPTGAALWFLRGYRVLWNVVSVAAAAIAVTGIASLAAYVYGRNLAGPSALAAWAGFAPLRMLAAPLLALAFLVAGLISPHRAPRLALLISGAAVVAVSAATAFLWFGPFRLQ